MLFFMFVHFCSIRFASSICVTRSLERPAHIPPQFCTIHVSVSLRGWMHQLLLLPLESEFLNAVLHTIIAYVDRGHRYHERLMLRVQYEPRCGCQTSSSRVRGCLGYGRSPEQTLIAANVTPHIPVPCETYNEIDGGWEGTVLVLFHQKHDFAISIVRRKSQHRRV